MTDIGDSTNIETGHYPNIFEVAPRYNGKEHTIERQKFTNVIPTPSDKFIREGVTNCEEYALHHLGDKDMGAVIWNGQIVVHNKDLMYPLLSKEAQGDKNTRRNPEKGRSRDEWAGVLAGHISKQKAEEISVPVTSGNEDWNKNHKDTYAAIASVRDLTPLLMEDLMQETLSEGREVTLRDFEWINFASGIGKFLGMDGSKEGEIETLRIMFAKHYDNFTESSVIGARNSLYNMLIQTAPDKVKDMYTGPIRNFAMNILLGGNKGKSSNDAFMEDLWSLYHEQPRENIDRSLINHVINAGYYEGEPEMLQASLLMIAEASIKTFAISMASMSAAMSDNPDFLQDVFSRMDHYDQLVKEGKRKEATDLKNDLSRRIFAVSAGYLGKPKTPASDLAGRVYDKDTKISYMLNGEKVNLLIPAGSEVLFNLAAPSRRIHEHFAEVNDGRVYLIDGDEVLEYGHLMLSHGPRRCPGAPDTELQTWEFFNFLRRKNLIIRKADNFNGELDRSGPTNSPEWAKFIVQKIA